MKKKLKKGFTLVELVIVIAVIAILSAILIPTFGNVISNAKESAAYSTASNALTKYTTTMAESQQATDLPNGYVYVFQKDVSLAQGEALAEGQTSGAYVFRFENGSLKQVKEDGTKYSLDDITGVVELNKTYTTSTVTTPQSPLLIDGDKVSYFGAYMLDGSVVAVSGTNKIKGRVLLVADKTGFTESTTPTP